MPTTKAQQAATQRYKEANYDRLNLQIPKGEREKIREAATKAGMSLNAYSVQAIREKMGREAND